MVWHTVGTPIQTHTHRTQGSMEIVYDIHEVSASHHIASHNRSTNENENRIEGLAAAINRNEFDMCGAQNHMFFRDGRTYIHDVYIEFEYTQKPSEIIIIMDEWQTKVVIIIPVNGVASFNASNYIFRQWNNGQRIRFDGTIVFDGHPFSTILFVYLHDSDDSWMVAYRIMDSGWTVICTLHGVRLYDNAIPAVCI